MVAGIGAGRSPIPVSGPLAGPGQMSLRATLAFEVWIASRNSRRESDSLSSSGESAMGMASVPRLSSASSTKPIVSLSMDRAG